MNKYTLSLATTVAILSVPSYFSTALAGNGGPPCLGNLNSVEIKGISSFDAKAEISCGSYSCMTKNPLMIEAATDAVLAKQKVSLDWNQYNWCTALEMINNDID